MVVSLDEQVANGKKIDLTTLTDQSPEPLQPNVDRYGEVLRQLEDLAYYSSRLVEKFPRDQKWPAGIGTQIMTCVERSIELIYMIMLYNPRYNLENGLFDLAVQMRVASSYVKVAYGRRYITAGNWQAWVGQTTAIADLANRMAIYIGHSQTV